MTIKKALSAAAIAVTLLASGAQASTVLVGQEVTCTITTLTCSPSSFIINAGAPTSDAQVIFFGSAILDIDFMDGLGRISFNGERFPDIGFGVGSSFILTLSGLLASSGAETLLSNLVINNVDDLTVSDIAFNSGVLSVDLSGSSWSAINNSFVTFEITEVPAVPLPASALLLLGGLAGLGIAARRRHAA